MPLLRQLEFAFLQLATPISAADRDTVRRALRLPNSGTVAGIVNPGAAITDRGYNALELEKIARDLLHAHGATRIARELRVEWNSRLTTTAGRADYRRKLISLNPRLIEHPDEIDRTLRHELAHILAQFRAGRRRILPHANEWQQACHDLGIGDEKRCHNLPFPVSERASRYLYRCPNCQRDFHRARRIKRIVACLACCRAHNGGEFDARFRLKLVQ